MKNKEKHPNFWTKISMSCITVQFLYRYSDVWSRLFYRLQSIDYSFVNYGVDDLEKRNSLCRTLHSVWGCWKGQRAQVRSENTKRRKNRMKILAPKSNIFAPCRLHIFFPFVVCHSFSELSDYHFSDWSSESILRTVVSKLLTKMYCYWLLD